MSKIGSPCPGDEGQEINLETVYSPENNDFFVMNPAASIQLKIVNPVAAKEFEEGSEFYVDFTPAEPAA